MAKVSLNVALKSGTVVGRVWTDNGGCFDQKTHGWEVDQVCEIMCEDYPQEGSRSLQYTQFVVALTPLVAILAFWEMKLLY